MRISDKVNIIMEELDSKASSIPYYMEENYRKAIVTALARIDKEEVKEVNPNYDKAALRY